MPLDIEKIRQLQALKNKPKRRGGGRKKAGVDTSIRDEATWFKLRTHYYNDEGERAQCSNPECVDPRPPDKGKLVAEIDGAFMCRYCFLDGYHNPSPAQEELSSDAA